MQETELSSPATAAEARGGTRQRSPFGALVNVGVSAALTLTLGASFSFLLPQEDIFDARAAFIPEFYGGETLATETSHPGQAEDETGLRVIARLSRPGSGLSEAKVRELAAVILEESDRHRLEPALVLAVIHVESSGRAQAVSPVGARGLMQIMPPTGEELAARHGIPWQGPDTLLDPVVNVRLGIAYLSKLTDRYQNVSTALTAYNWGPGRIDRRLRAGKSMPTLYRDRVMRAYDTTKQAIAVGRS